MRLKIASICAVIVAGLCAHAQAATHTLDVSLSEDAYLGDANAAISLDAAAATNVIVKTLHSGGTWQHYTATISDDLTHALKVSFTNDEYGGSPATDRNLYVGPVLYDGVAATPAFSSCNGTGGELDCGGDSVTATLKPQSGGGTTGPMGPTGPKGDTGTKGDKGDAGPMYMVPTVALHASSYTVKASDAQTIMPFSGSGIVVTVPAGVLTGNQAIGIRNYNPVGGSAVLIVVPDSSAPKSSMPGAIVGKGVITMPLTPGSLAVVQVNQADANYNVDVMQ